MTSINWSNITTPTQLMNLPNLNTNNSFWTITVFMIWIVMMIISSMINFEVGLLFSSFVALVFSIFLVYAGLVSWSTSLFFIGTIVFTILYIVWSSNRD